ncbi:HYR domain-containing protein [Christiangramia echinicola]|uniref:HYR domain-containing protein n=1 Tax=Christiangramia echinicola TaxID=279359 RepID=UPI0003FBDE6C|nr:HYR domain-containing protein [Christiangramia echinicola]
MKAVTFIFFLFYFSGNVFGQDPANTVPEFYYDSFKDLGSVTKDENSNLTIAIETDSNGNIYQLTFGNGVFKYDSEGNNKEEFISANKLDAPLDFAIDSNDNFFIIDYEDQEPWQNNGKIRVFDRAGQSLNDRTILTSYFRPLGIALDNSDNIYVALYNSPGGTESTESSEIRVYDNIGNMIEPPFKGTINHELEIPYRLAVDFNGNLYVSHSGNDGEVLVFDSNFSYLETLNDREIEINGETSTLGTPGSIKIDNYGYIHIIDYADYIDFEQILNYEDLSDSEFIGLAIGIFTGVSAQEFNIKIFDPNRNLVAAFYDYSKDKLKLPVDIAFGYCQNKMYVDNANPILSFPVDNSRIDFNLLLYERKPQFDITDPVITCPVDITVQANAGKDYAVVTYNNATATDLCGVTVSRTSGLASGSQFPVGENMVEFTATDSAGNSTSCTFKITVEPADEEDTPPVFKNCPGNIIRNNDPRQCGAVVTFDTPTVIDDNESVTPTRIDGNTDLNSGDEFPVGVTTIIFEANDGVNNAVYCSFTITVIDAEDPEIICPDNKVESFDSATGYEVPDFTDEVEVSDNCTSSDDLIITQSPQEGDFITESQVVTITVEDSAGLRDSCTFQLTLEEQQQYELECIGDLTVRLGEDAQNSNVTEIETSEFITSDISNLDLALRVLQFTCEDIGTNPLTIRASDKETGEPYSCTVNVTVVDVGEPLIICPAGVQTREIPASGVYELPDFSEVYSISDNCSDYEDLVFTQDPLPGTEYTEEGDYEIVLTATDVYNNTETCEVTYRLIKSAQPSFECPVVNEIDPIIKNSECDYEVLDYSSLITNFQNFSNTPFISSEYVKNEDFLSVSLEVYDGENGDFVGDCVFEVPAIDDTAPNFENCSNRNLSITIAEGSFWNLQDFRDDFTATDNCDADLEYTQDPEPGTPINETTDVAVRVTDGSDNTRSCLFTIDVTIVQGNDLILNCPGDFAIFADENCEYRVPDLSEAINVSNDEAIIEQSLEINSIFDNNVDPYVRVTATFEGESVFCDIYLTPKDEVDPVIECPADETINLGDGESYILPDYTAITEATDNCGEVTITQQPVAGTEITEDVDVVVTARDSAGNTTSCDFQVNIVREGEISISCPEDITAAWDENCEFVLPDYTAQAGINSNGEFEIMQTPAPGTIITAAETEVTISVSDNNSNDSCSFILSLEDNTPPALNLKNTSAAIDSDGIALISFADIDNGSFDNCDSEVNYVLSKLTYTCKNLGENLVQITAEDSNGNISTGTAVVTITDEQGFCDDPVIGSEYIFIYPNPNIGSFKIATPADVVIERVEVFDHRGRFIAAKDFESTVTEYSMNLGPLQEAVYVLKIVTNEKTFTKRFIFKY